MVKFCRVCDTSVKEFNEGKGILKVQGLNFEIEYNKDESEPVLINGIETSARLVNIYKGVIVDIDDLINVTKAQRKDLKNGVLDTCKGKYKGIDCNVFYNKSEKDFYITLDLQVVLYN